MRQLTVSLESGDTLYFSMRTFTICSCPAAAAACTGWCPNSYHI